MMRRLILFFVFFTIFAWVFPSYAEIVVIVNRDNEISKLEKNQVIDLYMGRYIIFPNGIPALPVDQPVNSKIREEFYEKLTGKSVAQINAYWARLIFSGRASPPRIMPDAKATIRVVRENRDAIAYIEKKYVDDTVKVVYSFD